MNQLLNQIAIITGGATGIGLGIANVLGQNGAKIFILDIDSQEGEKAINYLKNRNIEASLIIVDITIEKEIEKTINQIIAKTEKIDILINNAGITGKTGSITETSVEEMDRVYNLNLRAVFLMCKNIIPHMLKRNYGRIVNIASIAGKEGNPKMVPYSATKAAVIGLTKSIGQEFAKTEIRVNCVTPAIVRTKILEQIAPEVVKHLIEKIPMKRTVKITEVANLVAWLASKECSASTGAVFDISGGRATY